MPALMLNDDEAVGGGEGPCRPFIHHGVELAAKGRQREGACPFCGKSKFSVEAETGLWRCWVCSRTGNPLEFLRQLWEASDKTTDDGWLRKLRQDRDLLDHMTLQQWGVCRSVVDGAWLVPGYGVDGNLHQLYRRTQTRKADGSWTWTLLPTPGVWPEGKSHGLHMASMDFDAGRSHVLVCEGPWDGMALWEVARQAKRVGDSLELTGNPAASILADANVVAVPGCTTWHDSWTEMCRGKVVTLMYDNDHPRDNNGVLTMAGHDAMRRVAGKLAKAARVVQFLRWGEAGHDASLSDGHDVRDALSKGLN